MKSIIPLLAISVLTAFALAGCNQNTPVDSTNVQSTNSSMPAISIPGGFTNAPVTNNLPNMNTNRLAGTNP
jgi:hypothetical protein